MSVRETVILDIQIDQGDLTRKIAENNSAVKEMKDQLNLLKKTAETALKEGMADSAKAAEVKMAALENEIRAVNVQTKQFKNTIDESTKANNAAIGSYEQLYRQWKLQEAQLKTMEGTIKRNADGTFELTERYHKESAAVKEAKDGLLAFNKAILDGRLNVGNYDNSLSGLEQKLGDLNELFKILDTNSPDFEKTREAIQSTQLQIDQLKGKVDEFGNREPKNLTKKGFEDATDAANGLVGAFTLLQLLKGKDENSSKAIETAMQGMAIATAIANVAKGYQGALDTLAVIRKKLLVREIAAETTATVVQAVATEGATAAQLELNVAMEANPVGILIIGILALGAALAGVNAYMTRSSETTDRLAEENEKLNKSYTDSHRTAENTFKVAEANINLMEAQGATAEELLAANQRLNDAKEEDIKKNIRVIESNIALDKSKIADIVANDSLYESYLRLAVAVYKSIGATEQEKATLNLIAANKKERAQESLDDLKKQQDALADAQAALKNTQADELNADKEHKKKLEEQARQHADEMKQLQRELEDSLNRTITDARIREIKQLQTDFSRKIAEIKGNSKVARDLRAQLVAEEREAEQAINEKYDTIDVERNLRNIETKLQLELSLLTQNGKEKLDKQLAILDTQHQEELLKTDLDETEKANIEEKYRQLKIKAEVDMNQRIQQDFLAAQRDKLQAELLNLQVAGEDSMNKQLEIAAATRDSILSDQRSTNEQRLLAEARYAAAVQQIQLANIEYIKRTYDAQKAIIGNFMSGVNSVMEIFGANQDQLNGFLKMSALFQLSADTAKAISSIVAAAAATSLDPITLAIKISAGVATVLANIATARKLILGAAIPAPPQIQGFATGGGVSGTLITNSHGTPSNINPGDNVLITAKTGEVILNEKQQAALGGAATFAAIGVPGFVTGGMPTLDHINRNYGIPGFDAGGLTLSNYTNRLDTQAALDRQFSMMQQLADRPVVASIVDFLDTIGNEGIRKMRAEA